MFTEEIKKISKEIQEKLINIRRTIHMHPELAFEEHATAQLIYNYLKDLDIEVTPGIAKTGVVGLIRSNQPGKTVAIRADMDALPMTEENECEYKSTVPGKMHACGHDVHVTCLLGAAEILSRLKGKLNGNIKLLFQPAEEGVGGALPMIEEGVLENPKVDACIAAHVWPDIPAGKIVVKNGPIMASPDDFEIIIKGKSGHGAMPHAAVDPIVIGCHVVNTLQTIVSRKIDPLNPAVISICYFHSGTCTNVIPDTATIKGTARTIDPELRRKIASLIEETVAGVVKAMGGEYEFDFKYLYPPTINDNIITDVLANSASKIIGKSNILWGREPSMGGEDFALGCGNPEKGITHPIHSTKFDVDEDCIAVGASILTQFAVDYLNNCFT
ncbi:MAG: amidohydrolase [Clostridia bacterium]|nr:amidohydrolase [Clostridia bacterium]